MDNQIINTLIQSLPQDQREAAKSAIPAIAEALQEEGILTPKILAYAVATAGHESSFVPKEEIMARRGVNKRNDYIAALQENYQGGKAYRGRGFIQLTHKGNYQKYGERIGVDLVNHPELMLDPKISAKVLAAYFKDAGVADLAEKGDLLNARARVQGKGALNREFMPTTKAVAAQAKQLTSKIAGQDLQQAFVKQMTNPTVMPEKTQAQQSIEQKQVLPVGIENPDKPFQKPITTAFSPQTANITNPVEMSLRKFFAYPQQQQQEEKKQEEVIEKKQSLPEQQSSSPSMIPISKVTSQRQTAFAPSPSAAPSFPTATPSKIPTPNRAYTVRRGDTPSGIAQRLLGDASKWRQVWKGDPRKMPAGITVRVPTPSRARA